MKDQSKTKQVLIQELDAQRMRIAELEQLESERKRASEVLRESGEYFKAIIQNSSDIILILDRLGTITYASPSVERFLGYEPDEVIGKRTLDLIVSEDKPRAIADFGRALLTKEVLIPNVFRIKHKNGTERILEGTGKNLFDNPIVAGFVMNIRDITEHKQAEEALRESEEKYRELVKNAPAGIYEVNYETNRFTIVNDVICEYTGYTRDELLTMNLFNLLTEESQKLMLARLEKLMAGEKIPQTVEYCIRTKGGEELWALLNARYIYEAGKLKGATGIIYNITDRRKVAEALRESEIKYRALIETTQTGYVIIDQVGLVLDANPEYVRLTGHHDLNEIVGRSVIEWTADHEKEKNAAAVGECFKKGYIRNLEIDYVDSKGSFTPIEMNATYMESEGVPQILTLCRDITERKRAEEALRESEEKYRGILENMDDAYYELDLNGNLVFFNEALILKTGYSRVELMGMNYRQYISPETCKQVSRVFSEIYRIGQSVRLFDYEVVMKEGQKRNYESWANLLFDNNKKPIGFRGIARDITERKRAEEELLRTLESLRKAVGATIQVMVSAVEARDPYTAGHQLRTADLARTIATEMGLPQDKINGIRMAGSIHDIGKLSIPAEILSKPTKLTKIEFSLIKEHSRSGYEMLKDVESPWPLAQIIYQHHERMDGSGYPRNLKGDDILMEARILAVADVVESMASHRPYRPALGIEAALEEIEKNRGTLYDNTVADACLSLFRERGYQLS